MGYTVAKRRGGRPTDSDRMWASLQASVFDADAVMGGTDVEAKMSAVSRLQSLLEDMQVALMREDEEE